MPIVCREGRASLGPRVFTRGNETLIAYYGGAVARFNGATRLHAWKRETEAELTRLRNEASMGPRVFTRGNESSLPPCFSSPFVLQWGHASSRVETGKRKTPRNFNIGF